MNTRKQIQESWRIGLREAGDKKEEFNAMGAKMRALCGCRVIVAVLFVLAIIISAGGCGANFMGDYRASLQDTGAPRFKMYSGKFEHNLFNGTYQKGEKEDWEDD
jgi:hypothetical protein